MNHYVKNKEVTLLDALDKVLETGAVVVGDLAVRMADVDLIYIGLRLVATSSSKLQELSGGPSTDPYREPTTEELEYMQKLEREIEKAESNMERQEIKKEMNDIISHLRKRTFADPDTKKAQSNIRKRLKTAYKAIDKAGIKGLAKHLRDYIKPDNAYGLYYSGATTWDITR